MPNVNELPRLSTAFALCLAALSVPSLAAQRDEPPQRLEVRSLSFEGNRAIPDATLAMSIATTQSSWFARVPREESLSAATVPTSAAAA